MVLSGSKGQATESISIDGSIWLHLNSLKEFTTPSPFMEVEFFRTSHADGTSGDWVEVLRINRHAFVIMDRDAESGDSELNETKTRIKDEIGEKNCWVTKGREIENYLSSELLSRYLKTRYSKEIEVKTKTNIKIGKVLLKATNNERARINYDKEKTGYAKQFADLMTADDLNVLDLRKWLERLVEEIGRWNHVEQMVTVPDQ